MKRIFTFVRDPWLLLAIIFLLTFSVIVLRSIAPFVFPVYAIFIVLGVLVFLAASRINFDIYTAFSKHLYVLSILLLIVTLVIGQVTRGTVRWIPIGSLTIQPAEIMRGFLILFIAVYLSNGELTLKKLIKAGLLMALPLFLILIQPSLGVAVLTLVGFAGVFLSLEFNKKYLLFGLIGLVMAVPVFWQFMAPYQRDRVANLFSGSADPTGAGYNSVQSMISVGSGQLTGRGLGEGVGTQLLFLPERHTDFIFASTAEELGFVGAALMLIGVVFVLYRVIAVSENAQSFTARAFVSGVFLTMFAQTVVHVGMNMGLLPITGLPLPLVSAGGSSLLGMMIMLGMVVSARK